MLWARIDTHLGMHRVEVKNDIGQAMWRGQVSNDRNGFEKLIQKLRLIEESNSQSIGAVFMNPTGNYHAPLQAFLKEGSLRIILVDARVSAHLRITENLGREKSDSADASILASTAILKPGILDSGNHERYQLSGLTRLLDSVKKNIIRIMNQIKGDIAAVFPEYPFYDSVDSNTSLAILEIYTTPDMIIKEPLADIYATMRKASRNQYKLRDAEELMKRAKESIGISDPGCIYAYRIRINVKRLREEKKHSDEIEKEILRISGKYQDVKNISDIRGIGMTAAATIVSEIDRIDQFSSAVKLQAYGGKAPNITGSGGKINVTGVSKIRNPHLSNAVHESAVSLVLHRTPEFLEIFNREINKGKKKTQAYIVVGKRLLYHVHSIMKNNMPYRERIRNGNGPISNKTSSLAICLDRTDTSS